jgi:quinol monooxygenase YgiN
MIVLRFKVQCQPEKIDEALAAFEQVVAPSRAVEGVISFDIGRDVSDPDAVVGVEVFEDRAALDRQESLPIVQQTIGLFGDLLAAEPEATIYHVSSAEPWGG